MSGRGQAKAVNGEGTGESHRESLLKEAWPAGDGAIERG